MPILPYLCAQSAQDGWTREAKQVRLLSLPQPPSFGTHRGSFGTNHALKHKHCKLALCLEAGLRLAAGCSRCSEVCMLAWAVWPPKAVCLYAAQRCSLAGMWG